MGYLQNINRLSAADNIGGLIEIQVARKAEVASIPAPVDGVVYGDIEMVGAAGFVTWQPSAINFGSDSAGKQSREGTSKGNIIRLLFPKDRATLRAMFEQATEDELIVLFKDANGQQKIFGLLDRPVSFRFSHSSGNNVAAKNGYECEFYYDGPENMFEYNGAIAQAPAGPAPAVVQFNGVAIASLQPGETLNIISEYSFDEYFITAP